MAPIEAMKNIQSLKVFDDPNPSYRISNLLARFQKALLRKKEVDNCRKKENYKKTTLRMGTILGRNVFVHHCYLKVFSKNQYKILSSYFYGKWNCGSQVKIKIWKISSRTFFCYRVSRLYRILSFCDLKNVVYYKVDK